MPLVTKIAPQKNGKRVNIYIDDTFSFGCDLDTLVLNKIKVGEEISEEHLNKFKNDAAFRLSLDKAINFAMVRPRSTKEVNLWLKRKKVEENIWERITNKLKELDLLDDYKFASWWIEQRMNFKPMGKIRLKQELLIKGITPDMINDVLENNYDDNEELKNAINLLSKKIHHVRAKDSEKLYRKLITYLVARGFNYETAKSAIDSLEVGKLE